MWRMGKSAEHGVSLAEALVAVSILAAVGVVIAAGLYTTVLGNTMAQTNVSAQGLARYELEYVKSVSDNWTYITNNNTPPWSYTLPGGHPVWDSNHNNLPSGYTGYSVTVQGALLSAAPYSNDAKIQQVTATVTYNGKQAAQISEYITGY